MRKILMSVLFLLLVFLVHDSFPCGIVTHNEVGYRASAYFASPDYPEYEQYVADYQDAVGAGAAFPDWGWNFGYRDESEEAHSLRFIQTFADYIYENYPKPWDEETKKVATFVLGVMVHYASDTSWHCGAGLSEGFLCAMGHQDFYGSFEQAHSVGDTGGDVVCSYEFDLSGLTDSWYIPVDDAAQVYNALGYNRVTPQVLTRYTGLLFLGYKADKDLFWLLYDNFAKSSPFLVEQFNDYFIGGLDDMAIWTSWNSLEVINWLENGVSKVGLEKTEGLSFEYFNPTSFEELAMELSDFGVEMQRTERGVIFRASQELDASHPTKSRPLMPFELDRSITFTTNTPYSYLGKSLAFGDFNNDGLDDLVIGAHGYGEHGRPQLGAVYVIFGRSEINGHESVDLSEGEADLLIVGDEPYSRFGWSIAVIDLNADGFSDLAVSAPTSSSNNMQYRGRIFIYFGGSGEKGLSDEPDIVIEAEDDYTNLGFALASGDVNGDGYADLLVGAPFARAGGVQRGLVAIFLSSEDLREGSRKTLQDADWLAFGENDYDWFGYSVSFAEVSALGKFVLVGAPSFNAGEVQSIGKLYGFEVASEHKYLTSLSLAFSISGTDEFDKVGTSFAVGDPFGKGQKFLALSAPTRAVEDQIFAGAVFIIPFETLSGELDIASIQPATAFYGGQKFGRLGWSVGFTDFNNDGVDDLWITEPYRETSFGAQAGAAYLYLGGENFLVGNIKDYQDKAFWNFPYSASKSLFGSAIAFPDFNGDGSADVALSAHRQSDFSRFGGSVFLAITPAPTPKSLFPAKVETSNSYTLTLKGERLYLNGLELKLKLDDYVLEPIDVSVLDQSTVRFVVNIPSDARIGTYDLEVKTVFGKAVLLDALIVIEDNEGARSDFGCGCDM